MKNFIGVLMVISLVFCMGCEGEGTSNTETKQTEKLMKEMQAQVGMPNITNFQEKKWAKMIFELRDKSDLLTYAYIVNRDGKLIYLFRCVGYGLPYSVQYTSPQKVIDANRECDGAYSAGADAFVIPQADPNGLYMPDGLSATWLMAYDEVTKEIRPVYVEPEIMVSPFKLH